jgi:alpha-beta hydrolase superfamily lysophospholipase
MQKVTSADGTTIAYDRSGDGPAVVLVCGRAVHRMTHAGLAALLAQNFTVYNYDRRGHGDSGDCAESTIEREFEDLDAILATAGGPAHLFGTASGATLALLATAAGRPVTKLALCIAEGSDDLLPAAAVAIPTRVFTCPASQTAALAPALKEFFA